MIPSVSSSAGYLRYTQAASSRTMTSADALPAADAGATEAPVKPGIAVSSLQAIDTSQLKIVSVRDIPEIRDRMAAAWLDTQAANAAAASGVSDDDPENTYATVKVDGKVVATLYNGGSVTMTNEAAAAVGDLNDPSAPKGAGPNSAQWRAERIAKAMGGTVEKASTAITQSEWKPRESTPNYTREQLDAAFEAMMAEQQKTAVQWSALYQAPQEGSRGLADVSA